MIYLILAIISSACVSLFMRGGEAKIKNNMAMFSANYLTCIILARLFMGKIKLFTTESGSQMAVLLGTITGVIYLASFVLLQFNIRKNGVVFSAVFMKLGIIIPTMMAIFVFGENPKLLQIIGIIIAIVAIIMINFEREDTRRQTYKLWLIILLIMGGLGDSTANIYDKLGSVSFKDHFLFYTFFVALICALILLIWGRRSSSFTMICDQGNPPAQRHFFISIWDILMGIAIGVPNYFSARFLLLAVGIVPAIIVYPVYSVATIAVVSLISVIIFKEKLSKQKLIAIGLIMVALAMLNI